MKTSTRIIVTSAAAVTAVAGMGATAFAFADETELFKSEETIAAEQKNAEAATALLVEQAVAIDTLRTQITEAEAALQQAQAAYEAALAGASSSAGSSTTLGGSTSSSQSAQRNPSVAPAPVAPQLTQPSYQEYDDDDHDEHDDDDHEEGDDDD